MYYYYKDAAAKSSYKNQEVIMKVKDLKWSYNKIPSSEELASFERKSNDLNSIK